MDPAREAKLFQRGCLAVFLLLIALGALAYFVNRRYLFGVGGLVTIWAGVCVVQNKRKKSRLNVAFKTAFGDFDYPEPKLKIGTSYGFPTFTLTFATEEFLKAAQKEGRLGIFKYSISELYGHCGSASDPFDPARAVWATVEGWESTYTAIN